MNHTWPALTGSVQQIGSEIGCRETWVVMLTGDHLPCDPL